MSFPTEQEHFEAVMAALDEAEANPFDYDTNPPTRLSSYTRVTVSDRFGGTPRQTAQIGVRGVRITVRAVGKTADNAREMRRRFDTALREQRLVVATRETSRIAFETAEPVAPDGDLNTSGAWFSALSTYTYTVA